MSGIRIGVAGLGAVSRFHLAAARGNPDVTVTALCDPDPERLARAARAAGAPGAVTCHRDHRDLLASGRVDAVVVNVPNDLHHPVCRDALARRIAVCVEKPLATRPADARELTELAARTGTLLFTAFHRRYNSEVRALRARTAAGPGIRRLTVRYHERIEDHTGGDRWYLDPARCGGGCVADNGPNAFDLVRWFLGEVRVVDADIRRDAHGTDRQARVLLRAAGGAEALVDLDWSYPGERKDVEVRLADGTVDRADMLAGHPGFKESLRHEYVGVLRDFAQRFAARAPADRDGPAALELVTAVYEREHERERGPAGAAADPDRADPQLRSAR